MSAPATPTSSRRHSPESDRPILLLDHSLPHEDRQGQPEIVLDTLSGTTPPPSLTGWSRRNSDVLLSRKWTLREELARRKYSKWQESRFTGAAGDGPTDGDRGISGSSERDAAPESCTTKNPRSTDRPRGRRNETAPSPPAKRLGADRREQYEIDILYENQRGAFVFGIPLFSQKSLLNFDPAPWLNAAFRDSPVNIMNAQVPDPSWEWAWKSWYVDMSADVDEEGWQYSFSFSPAFSWHGAHVWFHSFVRRRRWLRKRVKSSSSQQNASSIASARMMEGHMLNPDYFTIHTKRDRSRDSEDGSLGMSAGYRWSHASSIIRKDDGDPPYSDDIRDIGSLMEALRRARIDREKVEAVDRFLNQGDEELYYLSGRMPEIMASFIFQASRRQLLAHLSRKLNAASSGREKHSRQGAADDSVEKRRIDNLLKAIRIADGQVRELGYWSDVKVMARDGESMGAFDEGQVWGSWWEDLDASGPAATEYEGILQSRDADESLQDQISQDQAKLDKGKAKL